MDQLTAKAEAVAVTIQANLESELTVTVDRHFEYSRLIEDIVEVQALSSLRQFYTEDAGYQLALQVDTDLINAGTGFGDGTRTASPANTGANWVNSNSYYFNALLVLMLMLLTLLLLVTTLLILASVRLSS